MAHGEKASNPNTPYLVYEFAVGGRVYYVGIGQVGKTRDTGRWKYIGDQLERLKREGTLPLGKLADIRKTSGAVVAAMIQQGLKPHDVLYPWTGLGRKAALVAERAQIQMRLAERCVLANIRGNPTPASTRDVLAYLGVEVPHT